MAQHTSITLVDDLDDTLPAQETVYFGVDGVAWEINLSSPHAAILREDLAFWVAHARRTAGHTHRCPAATSSDTVAAAPDRGTRRTVGNPEHTAAVRAWATSHGYGVSDRGRIPTAMQQAFDAAH